MELAELLNQPQSFVSKIESGQRKLDLRQFVIYLRALDADPVEVLGEYLKAAEPRTNGVSSKSRGRIDR